MFPSWYRHHGDHNPNNPPPLFHGAQLRQCCVLRLDTSKLCTFASIAITSRNRTIDPSMLIQISSKHYKSAYKRLYNIILYEMVLQWHSDFKQLEWRYLNTDVSMIFCLMGENWGSTGWMQIIWYSMWNGFAGTVILNNWRYLNTDVPHNIYSVSENWESILQALKYQKWYLYFVTN